jgi:ribonuclease HI
MSVIYTDGSCLKNPNGPGGWAFCIIQENDKDIYYYCGGESSTTNNRMELTAVIEALLIINSNKCTIYSDSKLTINCAEKNWKRKANLDLWLKYDEVSYGKDITYIWVKAHNGNMYNEKVDKIAKKEASYYINN